MRKILFCNIREQWTIRGHKQFDIKWVNLMASLFDVTVLTPMASWYDDCQVCFKDSVKIEVCNFKEDLESVKVRQNWNKKFYPHIPYRTIKHDLYVIKEIEELDKKYNYDYIVASTADIFALFLSRKKTLFDKLYVIEHSCNAYTKRTWRLIYTLIKNKYSHIVMEQPGVDVLKADYMIPEQKICYIPHMLNIVDSKCKSMFNYDIVGISNSNDEEEISKIIEYEKEHHFFETNKIHAIFRSRNLVYESEYLKVFKGRMGLSYEDYNGILANAKILILPFGVKFGVRSSGTIQDALSLKKPIIGSPFGTLNYYKKMFPHICYTYSNIQELERKILQILNDASDYSNEFASFAEQHSDECIRNQMKKIFD